MSLLHVTAAPNRRPQKNNSDGYLKFMDGNSDSVKKNRYMVSSSYNYYNNHEFRAILGVSIQTFRSFKIWGDFFGPQRSRCVGSTQFRAGQFYFVSMFWSGQYLSCAVDKTPALRLWYIDFIYADHRIPCHQPSVLL